MAPKLIQAHHERVDLALDYARTAGSRDVVLSVDDAAEILAEALRPAEIKAPVLDPPSSIEAPFWQVDSHIEVLWLGDAVRSANTTRLMLQSSMIGSFCVTLDIFGQHGRKVLTWGPDFVSGTDLAAGRAAAIAWAKNTIGSVARDLNLASATPEGT